MNKKITLSNRMMALVSMISKGGTVADIGCDHAYVSIYLIKEKIADSVIAMDIKKGPLEIARMNIDAAGVTISDVPKKGSICVRLSDGGKELKEHEAATCIIAGMGGMLMEKILSDSEAVFRSMNELVLQPQSDYEHFRRFLYSHGYEIVMEDMIFEDGKFYPMMKAVPFVDSAGIDQLSQIEYMFGPKLLKQKNSVLLQYLLHEKESKREVVDKLSKNLSSDRSKARLKEIEGELDYIEMAVNELSN